MSAHRRFWSPPTFLTYELQTYSRSPSPEGDSDDTGDSDSDRGEGSHIMGHMELEDRQPPASHDNESAPAFDGNSNTMNDEGHSEDSYEERARLAEKRNGKRSEQAAILEAEAKARRKAERRARRDADAEEAYRSTNRPILTIKSSQGFVWNQDLFIPAWQKDRYLCSTSPNSDISPPTAPTSFSSGMDFEVECVDIHIPDHELRDLVPRV